MQVQILDTNKVLINGSLHTWAGLELILSQLVPGGYEIVQGKGKYFILSANLIEFFRLQRQRRTSLTVLNIT